MSLLSSIINGQEVLMADLLKEPNSTIERRKRLRFLNALYEGKKEQLEDYIDELIVQKYHEEPLLYQRRKDLFVYHNHVKASIREICDRFSTGSYVVGLQQDASRAFLPIVQALDDHIQKHYKGSFLRELLKFSLKEQFIYAMVLPSGYTPTEFETVGQRDLIIASEAMGLGGRLRDGSPLLHLFRSSDLVTEGDDHARFLTQAPVETLDGETYYSCTQIVVSSEAMAIAYFRYEWNGDSGYRAPGSKEWKGKAEVAIQPEIYPVSAYPIVKLELPSEMFLAETLSQLQIEYCRIHNSMISNAHAAGHIQPWFTPLEGGVDLLSGDNAVVG